MSKPAIGTQLLDGLVHLITACAAANRGRLQLSLASQKLLATSPVTGTESHPAFNAATATATATNVAPMPPHAVEIRTAPSVSTLSADAAATAATASASQAPLLSLPDALALMAAATDAIAAQQDRTNGAAKRTAQGSAANAAGSSANEELSVNGEACHASRGEN
eukprot:2506943-Pleurochrysis_carterae.AAC.1